MNGYQPEKRCSNCLVFNICKKKYKNQVCKKYKECRPAPPKTGSNANIPTSSKVPPMPEVKPPKQCTVLSVRDFVILYNVVNERILKMESQAQWIPSYLFDKEPTDTERAPYIENNMQQLKQNPHYQDLLRIREKLGELNIEIETPSVEVKQ